MEDKKTVGPGGKRSSLGIMIDRVNTESIIPSIPLVQKVACIDHCAARVTEILSNRTLEIVVSRKDISSEDCLARVDLFCRNLIVRDIHQMDRVDVIDGKLKSNFIFWSDTTYMHMHIYTYIYALKLTSVVWGPP